MNKSSPYKPDIKFNIAVYPFPEKGADDLIRRITGHMPILRSLRVEGIMVSFKDMTHLESKALLDLTEKLSLLHTRYEVHFGMGDYSHQFFPILLKFIKATPVSLFKNIDIMALAIGTSPLLNYSSILVYIEDPDEARSIVSHLISKQYFVVLAESKEEMRKILERQKKSFDKIVIESHFGNLQEEVNVTFKNGIFNYSFQGSLDVDLDKSFRIADFEERVSVGYKIFIFDLNNIFHMEMHAAYIFVNLLAIAKKKGTIICLAGLNKHKVDNNAYTIINKNDFWSYDNEEDIYNDPEVQKIILTQCLNIASKGISKKIIVFIPKFIKAVRQILDRLDIKEFMSQSKQCMIGKKPQFKPYISTHISFSGDYVGEVNFIFPKGSVDAILERRDESAETLTKEDHLDALKEFSGTIMGRLKANLEKNNYSIESEFPRAVEYKDIDYECSEHQYIIETFYCDGNPFYVTITDFIPEHNTEEMNEEVFDESVTSTDKRHKS